MQRGDTSSAPPPSCSSSATGAMDFMAEGAHELLRLPQERTAMRTRQSLFAAGIAFAFSHGLLAITIALAWEADLSWWGIFVPVWLGDIFSAVFCILSWFASCPYVKLCLSERQARCGDTNPSILTDILPDIVWAVLGLLFVCLSFVGEVLLCRYLDHGQRGEQQDLWPSACVFLIMGFLACLRGILVSTSGEPFFIFGLAVLITTASALMRPAAWVLMLPSSFAAAALIGSSSRRLRRYSCVLSREEQLVRLAEQVTLLVLAIALVGLTMALAVQGGGAGSNRVWHAVSSICAVFAGTAVCSAAALRARMAMLEIRQGSVADRLLSWQSTQTLPPLRVPTSGGGDQRELSCSGTDLRPM